MAFLDPNLQLSFGTLRKYILLKTINGLYNGFARLWILSYRFGLKKPYRAKLKVISVGNITVGGTGKTPMVDWILDICDQKGIKAAVITRGYKSESSSEVRILNQNTATSGNPSKFGDEPWLLHAKHPDAEIFVSPNRVKAAQLAETSASLLILDDGMQHLRIERDLDIVLIDTTTGFGNGHLLPLGPLREPITSLKRSDVLLFTKTNLITEHHKNSVTLPPAILKNTIQFKSQYLPERLLFSHKKTYSPITVISKRACLLFSGIGNPTAFQNVVEGAGGKVLDHLILDDHQEYDDQTISQIKRFAARHPYDFLLCTEKDWVKLEKQAAALPEIQIVIMRMVPDSGLVRFFEDWLEDNLGVVASPI